MRKKRLKLFVWEGVFKDYFPGMAVALAYNIKQAKELVARIKSPARVKYLTAMQRIDIEKLEKVDPDIVDLGPLSKKPRAWYVHGGG